MGLSITDKAGTIIMCPAHRIKIAKWPLRL